MPPATNVLALTRTNVPRLRSPWPWIGVSMPVLGALAVIAGVPTTVAVVAGTLGTMSALAVLVLPPSRPSWLLLAAGAAGLVVFLASASLETSIADSAMRAVVAATGETLALVVVPWLIAAARPAQGLAAAWLAGAVFAVCEAQVYAATFGDKYPITPAISRPFVELIHPSWLLIVVAVWLAGRRRWVTVAALAGVVAVHLALDLVNVDVLQPWRSIIGWTIIAVSVLGAVVASLRTQSRPVAT